MLLINDESTGHRARRAARHQWSLNPAGTTYVEEDDGTPEFYARMTDTRYELQPWLVGELRQFAPDGRLLEIGSGAGTDHAQLAAMAETTVAIDLADRGAWLTSRRLQLEGKTGVALVADGEGMPFRHEQFDCVYSFGVIHHTDNPEDVVAEMYRIMRPGGRFFVALYHRNSMFALGRFLSWIVSGSFRREPWPHFLGRVEAGAAELTERPVVRLYTRRGAETLFRQFVDVRTRVRHFGVEHPRLLWLSRGRAGQWLARRWGWYVIVSGSKPSL